MHRVRNLLKLPVLALLGGLLILLRYILRTPQPLASPLPGESHIYKWTQGYVFFKVYGDRDAPPLLLLHAPGIGASAYEILPIMEGLAQHYRVYAPDLPGFGLSDAPAIDYTADVFVSLCQDFLRDIVQRPATLLASGLSCNYAVAIASSSPELCTQLVLLSPVSLFEHARQYPRLSRLISRSALFGIFLYALLTPRFILLHVIAQQHTFSIKPISNDDLNYYFAAAHQLGAQYASLAFVTGRLYLDVTLDKLLQPTLILWIAPPRSTVLAQSYTSSSRTQVILLTDASYHTGEQMPQNVVANILRWQREEVREETPIAIATTTIARDSATLPQQFSPPAEHTSESDTANLAGVENPQPAGLLAAQHTDEVSPTPEIIEAFCVKCKQKRTMHNPHRIVTKNGRNAIAGTCPVCSTRLFRFISK